MIPNYGDKYGADALFSPTDAVSEQGEGMPDVPPAIILGYQAELTDAVKEQAESAVDIVRSQRCYPLSDSVGYLPVHEWGIGAPITATVTENVIAAGAEVVVMLGGCAGLQTDIVPDAAILPTDSIRDEGVSYHYRPPDASVTPTGSLVDALDGTLSEAGFETPRGTTWTTSAMYRETIPEIEQYQEEGVVSLCMESAALWSVCQYRGADTATVHEIGDYLTTEEWVPESGGERGLVEMLEPTVRALDAHLDENY
jgi:uridine phosphorylase